VKQRPKALYLLYLVLLLMVIGTVGYMLILDVGIVDALYMTVITVSTVGFREIENLEAAGKLFTMFIIFSGLGLVAYVFSQLAVFLAEGEFKRVLLGRRVQRRLDRMKNHYIVCGAGQTSVSLIEQFNRSKVEFVIIEKDHDRYEELLNQGFYVILGDATDEQTLLKAGIKEASGLVSTLGSDAENVFTVLTAREINKQMQIVAKAKETSASQKLRKAGANSTINPNELGGHRIAVLMLRPQVISFLDAVTRIGEQTLDLGEIEVPENSLLAGKRLMEARIPEITGLIVLAIKESDGSTTYNPSSSTILHTGLSMLVLGRQEQITALQKMTSPV
jgi:voltage-gated potassium channel